MGITIQEKAPEPIASGMQKPLEMARKAQRMDFESAQIRYWLDTRADAFNSMASVFQKPLENDYAAKKNDVKLKAPEDVNLGIYQEYAEKSIGIACVFFYREGWKAKADEVAANINWEKVRKNADMMIASRDKNIRPNLSEGYLTMVAVLSDAIEQLTGVGRNTLLAIMTQETRMDHNYYNDVTKNRGICQLTGDSPLFTLLAWDNPRFVQAAYRRIEAEAKKSGKTLSRKELDKAVNAEKAAAEAELRNVMKLVLPEKESFENAKTMMAGLFHATKVSGKMQGDITMNIIAGALTYRYKYCMNNNGKGALDFAPGVKPTLISYHRRSVEDYNGTDTKAQYATAVRKYWAWYSRPAPELAMVPRKKEAAGLAYADR